MLENLSSQNISNYQNLNPKYITFTNPIIQEKNDNEVNSNNNKNYQNEKAAKASKAKRTKIAALSLIAASLITLVGVLTKARGFNKKVKKILSEKITAYNAENILNLTKLKENIELSAKEGRILKISNFLNNLANIKDCYLLPFLNKIPLLRSFAKKTSQIYTDTGISMTQAAYKHAKNSYANFDKLLKNTNTDDIARIIEERNSLISKYFSPENIPARAKEIESKIDSVNKKGICIAVRDKFNKLIKKAFKEHDFKGFGEFIAEDMVKEEKAKHIEGLREIRDLVLEKDNQIIDLLLKSKIDEKQYNNLISAKTNAEKSLNNSIRTECNDLFDKIRDIKIGSAPNDVLGMISTTGMLGLYLAQAEDKNQRVEAALTTGVPLGLGMLSTTFATMKMYTGIKALAFGTITTFIANTIGKIINKEYQKRHNIKHQEIEIPTIDNAVENLKQKIAPQTL